MLFIATLITCFVLLFFIVFKETKGTSSQSALIGWLFLSLLVLIMSSQDKTWNSQLSSIATWLLLSFLLLFSYEVKRALAMIDLRPKWQNKLSPEQKDQQAELRRELAQAAVSLSKRKEGALMVIEQRAELGEFLLGGVEIDARVKSSLIHAIFCHNGNDFHDGAIVIRSGKIWQAKAFLPMPHSIKLSQKYGTRHLAAVGITDHTDAVVIVVSEERGTISIAYAGQLIEYQTRAALEEALLDHII